MRPLARSLRRIALAAAGFAALASQAGGPLQICSGQAVNYPGAGTVTLNYDGGGALGPLTKLQADALVTSAVSLWTNVGTSTVTLVRGADLPVDVTAANYSTYFNGFSDGLNPIIYDSDGTIIDDIFGVGAKGSILGVAGSAYTTTTCKYLEGRGVISGYLLSHGVTNTAISVAFAHEVGHLIGLDHSQLDTAQGLLSTDTPLMYPIAQRNTVTLHDDDIAAVSALYPDATLATVYGQVSGNFRMADNATPIRGANIWAREQVSGKVYSVVSDYLTQGNGFFKLLLPAGTYTLHAEAIHSGFTSGSSVGPYSDTFPTDPSFEAPLYVGGAAMAPVTLGGAATPTQFSINPGCAATATFTIAGTGAIGGDCTNKATPSITVGSSANPAVVGTSVVITAVLSGSAGAPTGTILFKDGTATVGGCSAVALSAGRANCTMASLSTGTHPITAFYSGDASYISITSSTLPQSITAGAPPPVLVTPSITVGSSANPSPAGSSVSVVAVLSGSAGTPTGTVLFRDGTATIAGCGAVALSGGRANCSMAGLSAGLHPITAIYSGNASYTPITSSTLPQTITAGAPPPTPVTPSITVGSSANPAASGSPVTIVAVLSGSAGTPTGTVLFRDGTATVAGCGAVALAAGRGNCTTSGLSAGLHPITAIYSGDASYTAITSSTLPQTINGGAPPPAPVTPSITVGSSANPSASSSVVITAVVSGSAGTPTGTVLFRDGTATVSGCSAVALSAGRASCAMSGLAMGTHPITAVYSGNASYLAITSSTLPQSITGSAPTGSVAPSITVGSSSNPAASGTSVTITAVISGSVGAPTGTFLFKDATTAIGGCSAVAISAGRATCTLTGLSVGTHPITAFYSGDVNYSALASSTLPQSIAAAGAPATPSITVGSSANPAAVGTTVTFTAVISGIVGTTPTGTFLFKEGTTTISGCSAVALSAGRAGCAVSGLAAGMHPITAFYSGDGNYIALASSTLPQTMQ